jgi:hypothetical protein
MDDDVSGFAMRSNDREARRPRLPLELLPDTLAVCRLEATAPLPGWVRQATGFLTVSRTAEELSITTVQRVVPADVICVRDYRALRVRGPLPLDLIGWPALADPGPAEGGRRVTRRGPDGGSGADAGPGGVPRCQGCAWVRGA